MAKSKIDFSYDYIIPMTDARRMEVYTAIFDSNLNKISETEAKIIDENSFSEFSDKKLVFCGNGAEKCKTVLMSEILFFLTIFFLLLNLCQIFLIKNLSAKNLSI